MDDSGVVKKQIDILCGDGGSFMEELPAFGAEPPAATRRTRSPL